MGIKIGVIAVRKKYTGLDAVAIYDKMKVYTNSVIGSSCNFFSILISGVSRKGLIHKI